ncbi:MAG TPA: 50S ribosomal protein L18 [Gemmatimonadaceae bacterium]|nr:50S ribosomal protein L18 [Gemmatimonadaceae bacterium]
MKTIHKPRSRWEKRYRRHLRVRKRVVGTPERPRLVVFRSLKHTYAQLVDDTAARTIAAASDIGSASAEGEGKGEGSGGRKLERARDVGRRLAARAKEAGISAVVFDRAGYRYHGRVKAVADGAREGGLEF